MILKFWYWKDFHPVSHDRVMLCESRKIWFCGEKMQRRFGDRGRNRRGIYGNFQYHGIFCLSVRTFVCLEDDNGGNVSAPDLYAYAGALCARADQAFIFHRWNQYFGHRSFCILAAQAKERTAHRIYRDMSEKCGTAVIYYGRLPFV